MKQFLTKITLLILTILIPYPVQAAAPNGLSSKTNTDDQQPLQISSNQFSYQDQSRQATYEGDVTANQGSRSLAANKIIVDLTNDRKIKDIEAFGAPAIFHYEPNPGDALVYARADRIIYVPDEHLLTLLDHAEISQNGNAFKGNKITYNTLTQVANSEGSNTQGGRPLMIIQPKTLTGS